MNDFLDWYSSFRGYVWEPLKFHGHWQLYPEFHWTTGPFKSSPHKSNKAGFGWREVDRRSDERPTFGRGAIFFSGDQFYQATIPKRFKKHVFPERRFVAGFFRRLLAYLTPHISHTYLTPHISHTYPSHHTYPTHIHSKRIPPIRIPPIRIRSTRIPPVRIHAMRIHSKRLHQQVLQYVSHQYVSHQYVSHQYVSMLCVSIQCVSIQKVCISRNRKRIPPIHIPPIRIFNTYPTSTDPFNAYPFKKFASAGMAMSMSIIAYHFIPLLLGGNGNEYRNLAFPSISLQNY